MFAVLQFLTSDLYRHRLHGHQFIPDHLVILLDLLINRTGQVACICFLNFYKKKSYWTLSISKNLIHPDRPEIIRTKDIYHKKQSQISYNQHHIIFTFHLCSYMYNLVISISYSFWISWTILKYHRGFFCLESTCNQHTR